MFLSIIFLVVFLIVFGVFYFFLTLDPWLERSKKVRGRIRMVSQAEGAGPARDADKGPPGEKPTSLFKDIRVSDIPTLNVVLARFRQAAALQKFIDQSNVRAKAGKIILLAVLLFVCGVAFVNSVLKLNVWIALAAASVLAALPFLYITVKRQVRFKRFEAQFPGALDLIARALKAGYSFPNALEMTAAELPDPVSLELKVIHNLQSLGWTLRQTLNNFVERMPLPDVKLFVTASLIHKDVGGNLAEVLENAAGVIRQRFILRRQLRSMTAQARMSGYLMTGLPFFVIGALVLVAPGYINTLFEDELGKVLLSLAAGMLFTGVVAIRWLLRIKGM